MKKTVMKRLAGAIFAAAAICFCGCSSNSSSDIYGLASSDDLALVRANAKTIIENAGGTFTATGIDFPADLMKGMSKEARAALAARGIDFEHIVANVTADKDMAVTFRITDQKAFDEYLNEVFPNTSVNEEEGYTFRKVGDETIIYVNSGIGYMLQAEDNGVARLKEIMQKAGEKPVAAWQKTAVEDGNALGLTYNVAQMTKELMKQGDFDLASNKAITMQFDSAEFANSYVKVNVSLDGAKISASSEVVNNNGNALKTKLDIDNVDTSMLKYANADDQILALCSMPKGVNWSEVIKSYMDLMNMPTKRASALSTMMVVASVLENIDGTVMIGFGSKGTAKNDYNCVLAAQMKEGKANEYLQQLRTMASLYGKNAGLTTSFADNTLTVKAYGFEAYAKTEGNALVISLAPITGKGGCPIPESVFSGKTAAVGVDIAKDAMLAGIYKMPFGVKAESHSAGNGGQMNAELTGVEGGFIENQLRAFGGK